jgi:hypothetical protein
MHEEMEAKIRQAIVNVLMSAYSETITPPLVKDLTDKAMDCIAHIFIEDAKSEEE